MTDHARGPASAAPAHGTPSWQPGPPRPRMPQDGQLAGRHGWAPPAPGTAVPPPRRQRGAMAALFDFGFVAFATPSLARFVYAATTVGVGLVWLAYTVVVFEVNVGLGVAALLLGAFVACLWLAVCRIGLELVMVLFRLGADLREIRARGQRRL